MAYPEDSNNHSLSHEKDEVFRRPGPWAPAIFDLEDMFTDIPGWMPQEVITLQGASDEQLEPVTWNGWDCPHFEKAAADLIVRQHNEWVRSRASQAGRIYPAGLLARFDTESDSYYFFIIDGYDQDGGHYTGEWEIYSGATVEVEPGHSLQLYPVGAWSWIWERSDRSR